ncbi:MAG: hypothetical protein ACTSV1_03815, partial [Alphaproteobacteria bacterium]
VFVYPSDFRNNTTMVRLAVMILLLTSQPVWAAGMWEEACEKDLSEVLDDSVRDFDYYSKYLPDQPNLYAKHLGVTHALCIDELIDLARKKDMSRRLIAQKYFITDLEWVRDLFNGEMSEIYRQAQHYIAQNDKGYAEIIGSNLQQWAVEHKYAPAEFDVAQGNVTYETEFSDWRLVKLAERGYVPAIEDMARRYLRGDGVEKNIGVAWYWLKRAQQENVDTSSITPKSLNRLLKEMDEGGRQTLAYFAHYYDDLDLSDITIPPAFRPLSANIPDPLSDQEVEVFIQKFDGLSRSVDREKYRSVERELVARTAGIHYWELMSIDGQIRPFGMNNEDFVHRQCNYHRTIEKIFPQGRDKIARQLRSRDTALSSLFAKNSLFEKGAARLVSVILQSGRLCPNPESKAITHALVWARRLDKMDPAALRELAVKHFEKSGSVSKTSFKLDESNSHIKNKLELVSHYLLAGTIQKFAKFKEQEK